MKINCIILILLSAVEAQTAFHMDYIHKFLVSPIRAWSETIMMGKRTCPDKDSTDVKDFNLPKLMGDWFVLFRSYSAFEENGHCAMKRITKETQPDEWY